MPPTGNTCAATTPACWRPTPTTLRPPRCGSTEGEAEGENPRRTGMWSPAAVMPEEGNESTAAARRHHPSTHLGVLTPLPFPPSLPSCSSLYPVLITLYVDELHRENRKARRRKGGDAPFSFPFYPSSLFSSSALQCRPLSVAIVTTGLCTFLLLQSGLLLDPSPPPRPPPVTPSSPYNWAVPPVNPLVFPLVSIVCVSGTRWQYLWCLSWSGRVLFLLDLISENRLKPYRCVLSGGCEIGRRASVFLMVGSCRNRFSHQAVFFFLNFLFSLMSGPRAPVMTVIQLEWICWW